MVKKTFCFSQITSCCIMPGYGHDHKYVRSVQGLRDMRKIAQGLQGLGYKLDEGSLLMDFYEHKDVPMDMVAQLCLHEKPTAYKIRGGGISIKIENFHRQLMPGVIGGESESGVRGYVELARPNKESFDRIEELIRDYLTVSEGGKDKDYFDLAAERERSPLLPDNFIESILRKDKGLGRLEVHTRIPKGGLGSLFDFPEEELRGGFIHIPDAGRVRYISTRKNGVEDGKG